MERTVYILGAGFSAPLGLPVMSNFLNKSKDMFAEKPKEYQSFSTVFNQIKDLSIIKNYFDADLFNIEEIISILEMRDQLVKGGRKSRYFERYIKDVIEYFTPNFTMPEMFDGPDECVACIAGMPKWKSYGSFVAHLHHMCVDRIDHKHNGPQRLARYFAAKQKGNPAMRYDIITTNYDRIIENATQAFNDTYYLKENPLRIARTIKEYRDNQEVEQLCLAKLHGSIDGDIIPPTWNKSSGNHIQQIWTLARQLIENANHIRIVGYSLPPTDTYVRYLLKAAVIESTHLKSIDVICLDPSGRVKKSYDDFICFNNYRFIGAGFEKYLQELNKKVEELARGTGRNKYIFESLEDTHDAFMNQ